MTDTIQQEKDQPKIEGKDTDSLKTEPKQDELTLEARDTDANGKPDEWKFSVTGKVSIAIISYILGFGSCYLIFVGL